MDLSALTIKESRVYIATLECGESGATEIAKISGLKRPTTYVILEQLIRRGLVSKVNNNGKQLFRAENPETLVEQEEKKLEALQSALPLLMNIRNTADDQPEIRMLRGEDTAITILDDTLTQHSDICWWSSEMVVDEIRGEIFESYVQRRVEKGIWSRGLITESEKAEDL